MDILNDQAILSDDECKCICCLADFVLCYDGKITLVYSNVASLTSLANINEFFYSGNIQSK